jgi:hypothetical protein
MFFSSKPDLFFIESVAEKNGEHSAINKKSLRAGRSSIEDFVVGSSTRRCAKLCCFYIAKISLMSMGKYDGKPLGGNCRIVKNEPGCHPGCNNEPHGASIGR